MVSRSPVDESVGDGEAALVPHGVPVACPIAMNASRPCMLALAPR